MFSIIYQPHIGEVFPLMQSLRQKYIAISGLPQRAVKAEQILLNGGIRWLDGWHVTSQSDLSLAYRVNGKCECKDRGVHIGDDSIKNNVFCKHRFAVSCYNQILDRHMNTVADFIDLEEKFNCLWTGQKFSFTTERSIFEFSQWLVLDGGRQSLPGVSESAQVQEYTLFEQMLDELSEQRLREKSELYDRVYAWMV